MSNIIVVETDSAGVVISIKEVCSHYVMTPNSHVVEVRDDSILGKVFDGQASKSADNKQGEVV